MPEAVFPAAVVFRAKGTLSICAAVKKRFLPGRSRDSLATIERGLRYRFANPALLETALTHASYANEFSRESNERLEFLGDAFLGCVVSRILYDRFPSRSEGDLSKARSGIVSGAAFSECARTLKLGAHLMLGKGEERSGGRERESILAGAFEALAGAVYLDAGYPRAFETFAALVADALERGDFSPDARTKLQEISSRRFGRLPSYRVVGEEGPPHERTFEVEVSVSAGVAGRGRGGSRKEAGRAAARDALGKLG